MAYVDSILDAGQPPANVFPESTKGGPSAMPAVRTSSAIPPGVAMAVEDGCERPVAAVGLPPGGRRVVAGYDLAQRPDVTTVATFYLTERTHEGKHALVIELAGPLETLDERRTMALELVDAAQDFRERHRARLRFVEDLPRLVHRQGFHERLGPHPEFDGERA